MEGKRYENMDLTHVRNVIAQRKQVARRESVREPRGGRAELCHMAEHGATLAMGYPRSPTQQACMSVSSRPCSC